MGRFAKFIDRLSGRRASRGEGNELSRVVPMPGGPAKLFGRDRIVAAILASGVELTLVDGESGVGKSALLAHVARHDTGSLSTPPEALRAGAASLQRGLIESLGAAVELLRERDGWVTQWASVAGQAAQSVAQDRGREIAKVVGLEFLALLRSRLGNEVGDALSDYIKELERTTDAQLAHRVRSAADPGVIDVVCQLAAEVQRAAGQDLVITLDNAENLDDADWALLQDLANELPTRVRVRIGLSTSDPASSQRLDKLLTRIAHRATRITVDGLESTAVAEWLAAEGLHRRHADAVTRATNGYCLHIGDAIGHLKVGGRIESLPPDTREVGWSQLCWDTLSADVAAQTRQLACFRDPPPHDRLLAFLGISEFQWGEVSHRLQRARIFTSELSGRPWFHEPRRRVIWTSLMSAEERRVAARQGLEELTHELDSIEVTPAFELGLAAVAQDDSDGRAADPTLDSLCQLTRDELAVAAALVELWEPNGESPAVFADNLLLYAFAVFLHSPGLLDGLESLQARGLLVIAKSEDAAVVVPVWVGDRDPERSQRILSRNIAILLGRAQAQFQRVPLPHAATTALKAVVQDSEFHFHQMKYGIGRPSLAELAAQAFELGRAGSGPIRSESRPAVLMRGRCESRPVYAVASFSSAGRAGAALHALKGASGTAFGDRVSIDDVTMLPEQSIPSMRLVQAARLLLDMPPASPWGGFRPTLPQPMSWAEYLGLSSAAAVAFNKVIPAHTADIMATADAASYLIGQAESQTVTAQVLNAEPGVRQVDLSGVPARDPYLRYRLTKAWLLRPGETLGRITWHYGRPSATTHPVLDVAENAAREAKAYNRRQLRVEIPFDPNTMESMLDEALIGRAEDALVLAGALGMQPEEQRIVRTRTAAVLVQAQSDIRREGVGADWVVYTCTHDSAKGPGLDLIIREGPLDDREAPLEALSSLTSRRPDAWTQCGARPWILEALGFEMREVLLTES